MLEHLSSTRALRREFLEQLKQQDNIEQHQCESVIVLRQHYRIAVTIRIDQGVVCC